MHICILTKVTLAHSMGGMQVHCHQLAQALAQRGHTITIVTTRHPSGLEEEATGDEIRTVYLPTAPSGRYSWNWRKASAEKIRQLSSSIDVIFSESYAAYGYAAVRQEIGIPYVPRLMGFSRDNIGNTYRDIQSFRDALLWPLRKVPEALVLTHTIERPCVRAADAVIAIFQDLIPSLQVRHGVPNEKIVLVPNGIEDVMGQDYLASRSASRGSLGIQPDETVLLMSGVVSRQKGMEFGLQAFADLAVRFPRTRLFIVGDGAFLGELKLLSRSLDLDNDRIVFVGAVPNHVMSKYVQASDVYLCPTVRIEGLPFTVLEALSGGLPVVASDSGGLKDLVTEGENGFLLQPGNVDAMASAIGQLLEDPERRRRMGEASRRRFLDRFTVEHMTDSTLEVFQQVLEKR